MKNIVIILISLITFCIAMPLFADHANSAGTFRVMDSADSEDINTSTNITQHFEPGYYSTQHTKPHSIIALACPYPPATNVVVYNSSSSIIFAVAPFTPVHDIIYSNYSTHIYNDTLHGDTHLVLQDALRTIFFDGYVCKQAVVVVYGEPGNYETRVRC